jgi:hypothetical protein
MISGVLYGYCRLRFIDSSGPVHNDSISVVIEEKRKWNVFDVDVDVVVTL